MTRSVSSSAVKLALLATLTISSVTASGSSSGSGDANVTIVHRPLVMLDARSGLRTWVDPTTPDAALTYTSS
ncbi:Beta-glucan synthesis-associated protein skn1, partial [Globisporangium polare]